MEKYQPKTRRGISNIKDISGLVSGSWTVLKQSDIRTNPKNVCWVCQCKCGHEEVKTTQQVRCSIKTPCAKCRSLKNSESAKSFYRRSLMDGAKSRGIKWNLTQTELNELFLVQNQKCAMTGLPIQRADSIKNHQKAQSTASLDRIDSSLPYTIDNVQWVHKDVNKLKMDFSVDRVVELANLVTKFNLGKDVNVN